MNQWKLEDNLKETESNWRTSNSEDEYYHLLIESIKENQLLKEKVEKLQNEKSELLLKQLCDNKVEEEFLNSVENNYLNLKIQYDQQLNELKKIKVKYKNLKSNYNSLRNSKLGLILLKYWHLKKSIRKRVGR